VWTGAENLAPTGIRSRDPPSRSESLYRLSYPGSPFSCNIYKKNPFSFYFRNRHGFPFRNIIASELRGTIVGLAVKYFGYKETVNTQALQASPIRGNDNSK
jgi:hypothetical protein